MEVKVEIPVEEMKKLLDEVTTNPDWLYIYVPACIGDFLINCGLSYAAQIRKKKSATVIIAKDRMKYLGLSYANIVGMVTLPRELNNCLNVTVKGEKIFERDNFILGDFNEDMKKTYDKNLNILQGFKKYVFGLPLDAPFIPPTIAPLTEENISALHEKYNLNRRRTIILLPHAKSLKMLDKDFWAELAGELKRRNFFVYTNVAGEFEEPVEGTEPIQTNFPELNYIADKVKCFIGRRSGAIDFLALTKAQILNIGDFPIWEWDISFMYPSAQSQTFYNALNLHEYIEENFYSKGLMPEILDEHIATEDVFFSYDELMKKILEVL